jgi:hypothetical protein
MNYFFLIATLLILKVSYYDISTQQYTHSELVNLGGLVIFIDLSNSTLKNINLMAYRFPHLSLVYQSSFRSS